MSYRTTFRILAASGVVSALALGLRLPARAATTHPHSPAMARPKPAVSARAAVRKSPVPAKHSASSGYKIPADEIIPVSQIHPGMVGYGLTVFQGTQISRFRVRVISLLPDQYMGRDLILCRMSGGPITTRGANIIAGMSGSPVYFDGRLAGAVSMGYEWPKEPVAMVTPIQYMEDAFNPRLPTKPQFASTAWAAQRMTFAGAGLVGLPGMSPMNSWPDLQAAAQFGAAGYPSALNASVGSLYGYGPAMSGFGNPGTAYSSAFASATPAATAFVPRPLMTPIFASGLSPQVVSRLAQALAPSGLEVAVGPGGGKAPASADVASIKPGSMIGVFFCTGDVQLGGYGTVTYRKGNRILAFGHPLESLGPVDFPLTTCYVADTFVSYPRSEKMCLTGRPIGALRQDRPWSVLGTLGVQAHMVPLTISVDDSETGLSRTFHIQCVNHPLLTSMIVDSASQQAISEVHSYPADSMVDVTVEVDPAGMPPIIRSNTYFDYLSPTGMGMPCLADMDRIMDLLQTNPFKQVSVAGIKISMHIRPGRDMSSIERISVDRSQVEPGDSVHVDVTLRPWKGVPYVVPINVKIPVGAPNGAATLMVTGGMLSPTPAPPSMGGGIILTMGGMGSRLASDPAASLSEMIKRFLKQEKNNDLVARLVQVASPSLNVNGERLYNLPPALSAALRSPRATGIFPLPDEAKTVIPVSSLILGAQAVVINIRRQDESGQAQPKAPAPAAPASPLKLPVLTQGVSTWGGPSVIPAFIPQTTGLSVADEGDDGSADSGSTDSGADGMDVIVPPGAGSTAPTTTPSGKTGSPSADSATASSGKDATETTPVADAVVKKLQTWDLHTQADFNGGKGDGVAIGSHGDLVLGPGFDKLQSLDRDDYVWVARPDAKRGMLLGTGNNGVVYREDLAHNLSVALKTPELDILSLAVGPDGAAYAGTAPHGYIYRIPAVGTGSSIPFFKTDKEYVLALVLDRAGNLYAGTSGGAIYRITPDGKGKVWYQSTESHVCALDIAANGDILAGTSPSGLVDCITPDGKASVLWDSADASVSAIVAMPNGDVLVGTAPLGMVYRIPADGSSATMVLKTGLPVHDMCRIGDQAYVASGSSVYEITSSNETLQVKNQQDQDILSLGATPDGNLLACTGTVATLYRLARQDKSGSYTVNPRDTGCVSVWGHLRWTGSQPAGSSVQFKSRTGNSSLPDASWSEWADVSPGSDGAIIDSPHGRYIQFRVTLAAGQDGKSPVVRGIALTYRPENRPPVIVLSSPLPGAAIHGKSAIQWQAKDPDGDALVCHLFLSDDSGATWKPLPVVDKAGKPLPGGDIVGESYSWDTSKSNDGSYWLKTVVSDCRSNPVDAMQASATVGPITIGNSKPRLLLPASAVHVRPDHTVIFNGTADGVSSTVVAVNYRIDDGPWYSTAPASGVFDSQQVSFQATTEPLQAGEHKLEVKAQSASGASESLIIPIKQAGAQATLNVQPGAATTAVPAIAGK